VPDVEADFRECPQLSQNFAPGRFSALQLGQFTCSDVPQLSQNLAVSRFSLWQLGQTISIYLKNFGYLTAGSILYLLVNDLLKLPLAEQV
jgi:hypothetical protein